MYIVYTFVFMSNKIVSYLILSYLAKLKKIFSTHGSPYKLTTDNGRQYTSEQFQ